MTHGTLKKLVFYPCNNKELLSIINLGTSYNESLNLDSRYNWNEDLLNPSEDDIDTSIPTKTSCIDYSVRDFQKFKVKKDSFNIFHNNINGLETKHDLLHAFRAGNIVEFDIIAVTET